MTPSYEDVCAAEKAYTDLCLMDTFDLPADHATYRRKVTAHIHFLRTQAAYIGTPGSAEAVIGYLYGPSYAQSPAQHEGRVSYYDKEAKYGYIVNGGAKYYFTQRHLKYFLMPIQAGDRVTFDVIPSREGMPKAAQIVRPDYIAPAPSPAQMAQKASEQKRKESEERRKAIRQAQIDKRQQGGAK